MLRGTRRQTFSRPSPIKRGVLLWVFSRSVGIGNRRRRRFPAPFMSRTVSAFPDEGKVLIPSRTPAPPIVIGKFSSERSAELRLRFRFCKRSRNRLDDFLGRFVGRWRFREPALRVISVLEELPEFLLGKQTMGADGVAFCVLPHDAAKQTRTFCLERRDEHVRAGCRPEIGIQRFQSLLTGQIGFQVVRIKPLGARLPDGSLLPVLPEVLEVIFCDSVSKI